MIRYLPSALAAVLLAASALAGSPAQPSGQDTSATRLQQATEEYISTKLDCDNMSQYRKDLCLRDAEEQYQQAKKAAG